MADFFRRNALAIVSIVLFCCSLQLTSLSVRNPAIPQWGAELVDTVIFPLQKAFHEVSESGKYIWTRYIDLINVETERGALQRRVNELEAQNMRLMELQNENHRLRQLLHFSEESGHQGLVASVIGREPARPDLSIIGGDPSNWVKTVVIDRGSADGVKVGLAVVDGNAIVGQTIAVSENSARVLLLTDNTSAIDAIVQNSRAWGIAEGGLAKQVLNLRYVEKLKESMVHIGDRVIASGVDGVFPKGALIGVVSRIDPSAPGLFQQIEVQPSVDFSRLENLMVLLRPEPGSAEVLSVEGRGEEQNNKGQSKELKNEKPKSVGGELSQERKP